MNLLMDKKPVFYSGSMVFHANHFISKGGCLNFICESPVQTSAVNYSNVGKDLTNESKPREAGRFDSSVEPTSDFVWSYCSLYQKLFLLIFFQFFNDEAYLRLV